MDSHKTAQITDWVRLSLALKAGSRHADDILMHFESASDFFAAGEDAFKIVKTLTDREIVSIKSITRQKAEYVCEKAEKCGCAILTPDMDDFPSRLKNIPASPLVLYVRGDTELIADIDKNVAVAVVGTRACGEYGRDIAYRLSYDMALANAVIVSGMALGIDTAAHTGALDAGGKTVAVLGCGADVCYPAQNSELMEKIIENGVVISEYAPGEPPNSRNFPQRNRIMSGLSLGVLMAEAHLGSGALITVKHAMEQGKDIFTVPMSIYEKNAAASLALIRDGAIAVGCARHILEEYYSDYFGKINIDMLSDPSFAQLEDKKYKSEKVSSKGGGKAKEEAADIKKRAVKPIEDIDSVTSEVYNNLKGEPVHINDIASAANLPVTKVLSALTTLEMLGLAKALPGRRYILKEYD